MRKPHPKTNRIGEKQIMKNGMEATITAYRSSASIDVTFSDGVISTNKTYDSFVKGLIGHPNKLHQSKKKNRVGEQNTMSNGMLAEIIRYNGALDIDVKFEDGSIRTKCAYKEFKNGNIAHHSHTSVFMAKERLGESRCMNCGIEATIIRYRNYNDIDLKFSTGEEVGHVNYDSFLRGQIIPPSKTQRSLQESAIYYYLSQLGFFKAKKGFFQDSELKSYELDLFHADKKIAIEVDGFFHSKDYAVNLDIKKNKICTEIGIQVYRLRERSLPVLNDGLSINYILSEEYLYNGLHDCKKELEEILKLHNIKLPYEDFIDFKRDLDVIQDFHFYNSPNYRRKTKNGEKSFNKATSQVITIIDYKDYQHVDVQFEDGSIVRNVNYGQFKQGQIKHPEQTPIAKRNARIGEQKTMNCGVVAKIIDYRNAEDMDIQFDSGAIVRGVTYHNFVKGNVKDPLYIDLQMKEKNLVDTHPEVAAEWHPTRNGKLTPYMVTAGSNKKIWWMLSYDDITTGKHFDFEWESTVSHRTNGRGCPYLSGKAVYPGFNDLQSKYPSIATEWHPTKNGDLTPEQIGPGSHKKVWWKNEDGLEWEEEVRLRIKKYKKT